MRQVLVIRIVVVINPVMLSAAFVISVPDGLGNILHVASHAIDHEV